MRVSRGWKNISPSPLRRIVWQSRILSFGGDTDRKQKTMKNRYQVTERIGEYKTVSTFSTQAEAVASAEMSIGGDG
jgi:hypothetical protein